ncbi:hypothetical protein [Actinoplanes solisilvae]|nr:hypothetical protein [Actinoplanes solisilvae]
MTTTTVSRAGIGLPPTGRSAVSAPRSAASRWPVATARARADAFGPGLR